MTLQMVYTLKNISWCRIILAKLNTIWYRSPFEVCHARHWRHFNPPRSSFHHFSEQFWIVTRVNDVFVCIFSVEVGKGNFLLWNSFFVFFFDCLCFEFLLRQVLLMNLMKNVMRLAWFNLLNFQKIQWIQILNIVLTSNNTCSLRISELASCFLCLNTCFYLGFAILLSHS